MTLLKGAAGLVLGVMLLFAGTLMYSVNAGSPLTPFYQFLMLAGIFVTTYAPTRFWLMPAVGWAYDRTT